MKRIFFIVLSAVLAAQISAQPPARRKAAEQQAQQKTNGAVSSSERAALEYPTQAPMPGDVVWRRDIYRSLDLTKDANAVLYYPIEPDGDQMNLFTYLFKLILRGQIKAYDYTLDGNEHLTEKNVVKAKDLMDRFKIAYEARDGKMRVNDADLPSAEVLTYYIKESAYFDQRTSTFHTKVLALCPVWKRADEFGGEAQSVPMFWVKYDEASPYLAKLPLMGSNLNNASSLTADDYFTLNHYQGKIYKTNNLQGKVLANYCTSDTAMAKEQKRIEKELALFEQHIWGQDSVPKKVDSTAVAEKKTKEKAPRTSRRSTRRSSLSSGGSSSPKASKSSKSSGSSGGGAPRVSVRRQRH